MDTSQSTGIPSKRADAGLSVDLYSSIVYSFSHLARSPQKENSSHEYSKFFRDELERLHLWGDGLSVLDGHLDETLSQSPELRQAVIARLYEMGSLIHHTLLPAFLPEHDIPAFLVHYKELGQHLVTASLEIGEDGNFPSNDIVGSDTILDDLPAVFEELQALVDCLMDLSLVLDDVPNSGGTNPGTVESTKLFEVSSPEALLYCHSIRNEYPRLPQKIVERLGEVNAIRSTLIISMTNNQQQKSDEDVSEIGPGSKKWRRSARLALPKAPESISSRPNIATSSNARQLPAKSLLNDPLPTASENSSTGYKDVTFNTFAPMKSKDDQQVPPLPPGASLGQPFNCPLCSTHLINITHLSQWEEHIFADLNPYICTIESCEMPLTPGTSNFSHSFLEWKSHELSHRSSTWHGDACPFCLDGHVLYTPNDYFTHVSGHLRDISLVFLPLPIDEVRNSTSRNIAGKSVMNNILPKEESIQLPISQKRGGLQPTWPTSFSSVFTGKDSIHVSTEKRDKKRRYQYISTWYCCECGNGPLEYGTVNDICSTWPGETNACGHRRCMGCILEAQTM